MTDRKEPGAAFWATVLLVVVLAIGGLIFRAHQIASTSRPFIFGAPD